MTSKYSNKKTELDGFIFDSRAEAAHYQDLKLRAAAGEIADLVVHPVYELQEAFVTKGGRKIKAITYEADFGYTDVARRQLVVDDVKGVETEAFKIKAKLFRRRYPDIELHIVPATSTRRPSRAAQDRVSRKQNAWW